MENEVSEIGGSARSDAPFKSCPIFDLFHKRVPGVSVFGKCGGQDDRYYTIHNGLVIHPGCIAASLRLHPAMAHPPAPDAVLHLAALHALAAAGFASTSRAASITLSTAMAHYLRLVAATCVERANLAGRSKVAALDVAEALEALGVRVGELSEWAEEQGEVVFDKGPLSGLDGEYLSIALSYVLMTVILEYVQEGLSVEEGIAQLRLVPESDVEHDEELEDDEDDVMDDGGSVKSEQEQIDVKPDLLDMRPQSPDLSWLPSLPDGDDVTAQPTRQLSASLPPVPELSAAPQSIAERYRRAIPYASSQLSQAHPLSPPHQSPPPSVPNSTTSLPSLISTYSAVASDPSISLRQNDLRRQAAELLRRTITPVDAFSPKDTLSTSIPPIRASPIVPSHSDNLPPKLVPINPRPDGILSSLVQQLSSPYLPPPLRDRLTSLRPPVAQMRHGEPVLYGPAVRGPDDALLAKAKGKHGEEAYPEAFLRRTWNSGPRGAEKYGRRALPTGRRVVCSGEGEPVPRMGQTSLPESLPVQGSETNQDARKVLLRLSSHGPTLTSVSDGHSLSPRTQVESNAVREETMAIEAGSSPKVTSTAAEAPAAIYETGAETITGMKVNGMGLGDIEMQ